MILFNLATRSRPAKMLKTYKSIRKFYNDTVLLKIDTDDHVTLNSKEYNQIVLEENVIVKIGLSTSKIDAINRDVPDYGWDILVNISDDMIITKYRDIEADFNGNLNQFIHYPDGHVNHLLPTMSVFGIEYYKRFGYVYHPEYVSLWCDNEAMDVAKMLNKYQYINEHWFRHEHPVWTREERDELGKQCDKYYRVDEKTYQKRKALNFYINA